MRPTQPPKPSLARIREDIAKDFFLSVSTFISRDRHPHIVEARWAFMWIARQMPGVTLCDIAGLCGGKDHATILHGIKRCEDMRSVDAKYKAKTDALIARFLEVKP